MYLALPPGLVKISNLSPNSASGSTFFAFLRSIWVNLPSMVTRSTTVLMPYSGLYQKGGMCLSCKFPFSGSWGEIKGAVNPDNTTTVKMTTGMIGKRRNLR